MRQSGRQINCRRCFPNAAFLICNRDDGSHAFLPPPMRMVNRADAIQQPGPYMWVLLAECPLALGHSTFVTHSRQAKSGYSQRDRWKTQKFFFGKTFGETNTTQV